MLPHWFGPLTDELWNNRKKLTFQEHQVFFGDEYPWNMSIGELWSWRGEIAKKLLGRMPTPEEMDFKPNDCFFDPNVITVSETFGGGPKPTEVTYYRRGRRLKEDSPRVRRYRESLFRS